MSYLIYSALELLARIHRNKEAPFLMLCDIMVAGTYQKTTRVVELDPTSRCNPNPIFIFDILSNDSHLIMNESSV